MKRILILISLALALGSCAGSRQQEYVDWLYRYMPLPDSLVYPESWWQDNVAKTLEVREKMNWNVPEREFLHFVLPLRVNNESLDDFRLFYADSLCERVKGMSMEQAALEINHWCHEKATYQPSDGRTSSPMATIARGIGRCGEESVLAVSALRAAGIPARQVYTPRWAHTDDNHAWVEAWVNGDWHFMGACEPEPVLDMGWFNSSVSRAMLLHTKVSGDYHGDEDVISRNDIYTEINVIRGYVPARRTTVTVKDLQGNVVEGARVEFKIYNYAEFFTVATYYTDENGCTGLDMGLGDMLVWASHNDSFGIAKADGENLEITLDHKFGDRVSMDFDVIPPAEEALPSLATPEQIAENAVRLEKENAMREAAVKSHVFLQIPDSIARYLSVKDLTDVRADVIEDAAFRVYKGDQERYANAPRVEIEPLLPYRKEIYSTLSGVVSSPMQLAAWMKDNLTVRDERNPQWLRIPPVAVLRGRMTDTESMKIFFVAACRSLGWPARLEDGTGNTQYWADGRWNDVMLEEAASVELPKGKLALSTPEKTEYYRHFTLAKVEDGTCKLLDFDEDSSVAADNLLSGAADVEAGYYMVTSGTRLANGGVLSHVDFFTVPEGQTTKKEVVVRNDKDKLTVKGNIDVEKKFFQDGSDKQETLLSIAGRTWYMVVAFGDKVEPNTHAVRQIESIKGEIEEWGKKVIYTHDQGILDMIRTGCDGSALLTPYVIVADSFGRVVYFSQGYNTSLATNLSKVIKEL